MYKIHQLLKDLPDSISRLGFKDCVVETYRVKVASKMPFRNTPLGKILDIARRSSRVYGRRPLYDKLDEKAAIYIARAVYPDFEEWLSYRLVPFFGEPQGAGELNLFEGRGMDSVQPGSTVEDMVRRKIFNGDKNFGNNVWATSRMCGIRPYQISSSGTIVTMPKHKYSALCYAAISYHMYEDYLRGLGVKYTSGIILNKFIESALTVTINGKRYGALFTPATTSLGVQPGSITVNRKNYGPYVYGFPGYWLNFQKLVKELRLLLEANHLTEACFKHYLGIKKPFAAILDSGRSTMEIMAVLHKLGNLLTVSGKLEHCSEMTGENLRQLIDDRVSDGPELKITNVEEIQNEVLKFFGAALAGQIS